jgi:hypothetical protein
MESLIADDVVVDRSPKPDFSNYGLGENALELLQAFADEIGPHTSEIDRVVKVLGGSTPRDLELIATLHFIARRQRRVRLKEPSKPEVIIELKAIKRDKFDDEEISVWYEALKKAGLI